MDKLHEVAALLGATYVPMKWRSDEPAAEDRGMLFFGPPTEWVTPQLFVKIGGYGNVGKFQVSSACGNWIDDEGVLRQERGMHDHLRYRDSIRISIDRSAQSIANDIKRRIADGWPEQYTAAVVKYLEAAALERDRMTWLTSIGLDTATGRDRGTVYYNGSLAVSIENCYQNNVNILATGLTRAEVEAVLNLLKEMQ